MHQPHIVVAIVTILAILLYFTMSLRVAVARRKSGIAAPAMTGDPELERTIGRTTTPWNGCRFS